MSGFDAFSGGVLPGSLTVKNRKNRCRPHVAYKFLSKNLFLAMNEQN